MLPQQPMEKGHSWWAKKYQDSTTMLCPITPTSTNVTPFSLCMGTTVSISAGRSSSANRSSEQRGTPKTVINQWKRDHIKNAVYAGLSSRSAIFWIHHQTSSREENLSVNEKHLYLYLWSWFSRWFFLRRRRRRCSLHTIIYSFEGRVLLVVVTRIYDDKDAKNATFF